MNRKHRAHAPRPNQGMVRHYRNILVVESAESVIHLPNSPAAPRVNFLRMCWQGTRTVLKSDTFVEVGGSPLLLFFSLWHALVSRCNGEVPSLFP